MIEDQKYQDVLKNIRDGKAEIVWDVCPEGYEYQVRKECDCSGMIEGEFHFTLYNEGPGLFTRVWKFDPNAKTIDPYVIDFYEGIRIKLVPTFKKFCRKWYHEYLKKEALK